MRSHRYRLVGHADVDPRELAAHPANWRAHPTSQRKRMRRVLEHVGVVQRVLVNQRTNTIIDGHMRVQLAIVDGLETIPVDYIDAGVDEELTLLASLDSSKALATADVSTLESIKSALVESDPAFAALVGIGAYTGDDQVQSDDDVVDTAAARPSTSRSLRVVVNADDIDHAIDVLDDIVVTQQLESHADAVRWLIARYA